MNEEQVYWVWLQRALGIATPKIQNVISEYGNAKKFYNATENDWRLSGIFTNKELLKIKSIKLSYAEEIIKECNKLNYSIITPSDSDYPEQLLHIYNPPAALYIRGTLPNINDKLGIAVIGTRRATKYGLDLSFNFCYELAMCGVIAISGGAYGVDTSALKGALQAGGKAICVIGSGLNIDYPVENKDLFKTISQNGAVISEYPPNTRPIPRNFPIRNRLIAAFAKGVFVIEAGVKSGSLITANLALEQGKDIFALPGDVRSSVSDGTNELIKIGAIPVTKIDDILNVYTNTYDGKLIKNINVNKSNKHNTEEHYKDDTKVHTKEAEKHKKIPSGISENATKIYKVIADDILEVDDICNKTNINIKDVQTAITELEILGHISSLSGGRYKI